MLIFRGMLYILGEETVNSGLVAAKLIVKIANPTIITIIGKNISQTRPLMSLLKYWFFLMTSAAKWIKNNFMEFFSLI